MGLWVQNLGVGVADLPADVRDLADDGRYWLPEKTLGGWSWASLKDMLSFDELEELTVRVSTAEGAPALAFSLHDEDSVVVIGVAPDGVPFRFVMNARAFNEQELGVTSRAFARGGTAAFANWTDRFAPRPVGVADVRRLSRRASVYELLTLAGFFPEPPPRPEWEFWMPKAFHGASGLEWEQELVGRREFAILAEPAEPFVGPPGPWVAFVVEFSGLRKSTIDANPISDVVELDEWLMRLEAQRSPVESVCLMIPATRAIYMASPDATNSFEEGKAFIARRWRYGRQLGEWFEVPSSVPWRRTETVAWLLQAVGLGKGGSQMGSGGGR